MLCECMRSVPRVNYCLAPYILSVQCAARGKGGAMLRGRIWRRWASTNGMTWPRIDGPHAMFCPRPNPCVSPCGYLVRSVAVSSPGVVCLVINASMSAANLYQNREVADNVLPASAGSAVPEVWRSTSAPTPGCSPDIISGSVPGGGVCHCCTGDSSAAACAARPLMLQGPLWALWPVLPLYSWIPNP